MEKAVTEPRVLLDRLVRESGADYSALSRMLGRNAAYIQQYIKRGSPRRLDERDRRRLADYFGIDEALLGAPLVADERPGYLPVPRLDVAASAGPGGFAGDEHPRAPMLFDSRWLRRLTGGDSAQVSIIRVDGDSMLPTLADGDEILVDRAAPGDRLRDGIYVLRMDGALLVKRVSVHPGGRAIAVASDNPAYPGWPEVPLDTIEIVGRVVWAGRKL